MENTVRATQSVSPSSITPDNKALSLEDQQLLFCAAQKLKTQYVPVEKLSQGFYGRIYTTCRLDKDGQPVQPCDLVLKVVRWNPNQSPEENESILDKEFKFGQVAGEAGVGPKVYDYGVCDNPEVSNNKYLTKESGYPQVVNTVSWILMEKLPYPTLSETYPYPQWAIEAAMEQYYKLVTQYNISQNDFKGDNILVDPQGKRVYLLDYGLAKSYSTWQDEFFHIFKKNGWYKFYTEQELEDLALRWEMKVSGDIILKTLTYDFKKYSVLTNRWGADTPQGRTQTIIDVLNGLNDWYRYQFKVPEGYNTFDYQENIPSPELYDTWRDQWIKYLNPQHDTW